MLLPPWISEMAKLFEQQQQADCDSKMAGRSVNYKGNVGTCTLWVALTEDDSKTADAMLSSVQKAGVASSPMIAFSVHTTAQTGISIKRAVGGDGK
jgi:hypothetical protein